MGVADCSKAASNGLFVVEAGCGVLAVAQRTFDACTCLVWAVNPPFAECGGGCVRAGGAFIASCKGTSGAGAPAGFAAARRAGGDESSEALLPPEPIIHPRCVAPRK
jgi:hypothetical protein